MLVLPLTLPLVLEYIVTLGNGGGRFPSFTMYSNTTLPLTLGVVDRPLGCVHTALSDSDTVKVGIFAS